VRDWVKFDASLSAVDREALTVSMRLARSTCAEQLDSKLQSGAHWCDVALTACFECQSRFLELEPWQSPPMYGDTAPVDDRALQLLAKMRKHGLSRYTPDPVRAIAAAEARDRDLPPATGGPHPRV
jgi:hypothetical protein